MFRETKTLKKKPDFLTPGHKTREPNQGNGGEKRKKEGRGGKGKGRGRKEGRKRKKQLIV